MSSADVDPQHSWADDVSDDMSVVSLDGSVLSLVVSLLWPLAQQCYVKC